MHYLKIEKENLPLGLIYIEGFRHDVDAEYEKLVNLRVEIIEEFKLHP